LVCEAVVRFMLLQLQTAASDRIIEALDAWRDLRDRSLEQMFLAIYGTPVLQALVGIRASDESPRRQPGIEPERLAFIRERISQIKAQIAEGGLREAVIRSGVYIGMEVPDVDERAFNELRRMRAEHGDLTLEEFKRMLREQFFTLIVDPEGALAAIPKMLWDAKARKEALAVIRAVVSAAGEVTGERARRLARIETILGAPAPTAVREA
jgi:hypothetical protein